jgi:hypothetical protein
MVSDYEFAVATLEDIPGIVALKEPNLPENGGSLSARQTADWFGDRWPICRSALLRPPVCRCWR